MDHTVLPILVGLASAIISILGTLAAKERSAGRDAERLTNALMAIGGLTQRVDKLAEQLDNVGKIARTCRTVLGIAGQTGEVPRYVPGEARDSGERPALP